MKSLYTKPIMGILFFLTLIAVAQSGHAAKSYGLQCEYMERPIGVDNPNPRLSWMMLDERKGAAQHAYRITIGTDSLNMGLKKGIFWDSGKLPGSSSLFTYKGKKLQPFTKYFWRLEVWDKDDRALPIVISSFETGLMGMENWKGTWISDGNNINKLPAPYFRKVFEPVKKVKSARAYIAAGGLYEL